MRFGAVIATTLLAAILVSCSYIKDFVDDPTASGEFNVSRDYEAVFKDVKSYALQCYQEKDYHHKTTINAQLSNSSKSAEISVVMRGIDVTKYEMHIRLKALGPNETAVKVRDLYVREAEHRLQGLELLMYLYVAWLLAPQVGSS